MNGKQFERFGLKPFLLKTVSSLGFASPTEIQEQMIPAALRGDSAIGQSRTGTGKTHSYLLPIMQKLNPAQQEVQAVITAPTRELATQIYQQFLNAAEQYEGPEQIIIRNYIGGTDKQKAIEKLRVQPHIVIGTPSRLFDLIQEQALFVHTADTLVIDEADLMLDMGFLEDVDRIASRMPEKLQMLVFSATIPEKLKPFLKKYMENPKYIHIEPEKKAAENLEHLILPSRHKNKKGIVFEVLQTFNPYLAIVFTNTKKMADEVADALIDKGLKVGRVHGDLNPRERKKMMKQIQDLEYQYIVATDLAARGIDIEGVSHVINYELPSDLDFYIHRVGRTARAGSSGIALTIYDHSDEDALNRLEKMGITFKHVDFGKDGLVEIGERNKRKARKRTVADTERVAKAMVKKPSKIKPGYKKKINAEIEKIKRRQNRLKNKK
ncbi:DEAD/DEAH box helicase [Neobacillus notoginsengisoli]|uniref:DEAD-box ATP-dependent RNA helicase CshB n=1 Tax=Neobacillus notoginsengisoli TaxID=1578198 RepID=A0A417YUQ4_9BACI|nr:DEAD/DEAH box helicase [Neobacillus notoginsengisoli]RHW41037.1 DEAD/DEAH box helicase [Neobacillus notoginsengisoli]